MGWLADKIAEKVNPFKASVNSPVAKFALAKDALKFGMVAGKWIEHNLPTSDIIASRIEKHVGKASPRVLDAYDGVANHWLTKKVVDFANEGGPITKYVVPTIEKVAPWIDKKTGASTVIAKQLERRLGPAPGGVIDAYDALANSGPDMPKKPVIKQRAPVRAPVRRGR